MNIVRICPHHWHNFFGFGRSLVIPLSCWETLIVGHDDGLHCEKWREKGTKIATPKTSLTQMFLWPKSLKKPSYLQILHWRTSTILFLSSILHHLHSTFFSMSNSSMICLNSIFSLKTSTLNDCCLTQFCFCAGIPIATSDFSSLFSTRKGHIASKLTKFIILVLTDMQPWHCQKTCQPTSLELNIRLINQFHAIKLSNCASLLSRDRNVKYKYAQHRVKIWWILVNSNLFVDSNLYKVLYQITDEPRKRRVGYQT